MRPIRLTLPFVLAAGLTACATTSPDPLVVPPDATETPAATSPVPYEPQFDAARLEAHVKTLGDDSFEGRGPATPGETKTVAYLTEQLRAAGAEPAGDMVNGQRQYTQKVPLLKSDITGNPQFTLNLGNGQTVQLTQGDQIALKAPLNGQKTINLANTPLLFVGNNRYSLDAGSVGQRDSLSDGVLSLFAVKAKGPWQLVSFAARSLVGRADPEHDFAAFSEAREVTIEGTGSIEVAFDGEVERHRPLALQTLPQAIFVSV